MTNQPAAQSVLLVGSRGMLATAWARRLHDTGVRVRGVDVDEIDITDTGSVASVLDDSWDCVINCAAWTDVDRAEADEAGARRVNADGAGNLADRCRQTGTLLVHYSTDYVFNGQASAPIPVDAPIDPIGAYGRTKAEGEARISASGCDHLIVRTSWLYAPWGGNFVRTIARLASERDELSIVDDQRGRPTSALHLADRTWALLAAGARGTFHVCDGGDACTWFDFGSRIVALSGSACRVLACTTADMPRPAPRPAYSALDLSATESLIGRMSPWQDNLADVMGRMAPTGTPSGRE